MGQSEHAPWRRWWCDDWMVVKAEQIVCVAKGSGGASSMVGREPHQGQCQWDAQREETLTADETERLTEARGLVFRAEQCALGPCK